MSSIFVINVVYFSGIQCHFCRTALIILLCSIKYSCLAKFLFFSFSFPALWMYHHTLSYPSKFLLKSILISLRWLPCMWEYFFIDAFKIVSLSLILDNFIIMCLIKDLRELNLFRDLWASWSWVFKYLTRHWNFWAIISLNKLLPLSPSLLPGLQ